MSDSLKTHFLDELLSKSPEKIASLWLLERIPHVFQDDRELFIDWKMNLASRLKVDTASVLLVGTSCVGVSLNPYKNYKLFDDSSDVDVAVVSDYHFNEAWRALRNLGSRRYSLQPREQQSVDDHVKKYIYWGTIAADYILPLFPFGRVWERALSEMANISPTKGRSLKARIYKDFESLRGYHVNNLRKLRDIALAREDA
jgi:hypothetical protein